MGKQMKTAITPTREEDYPEWYQQVVKASDLAENSPVRGCMVIKPWGYAVWEKIVANLDRMFKETGVKNAYFPLFIPLRFLQKEAKHVEGFATECAVVTHHRLEKGPDGNLVPAGELTEPLIVRPTSETIIGDSFSRWVSSYRDLPILLNQWANVVRWEMRPRVFLRTAEFLWQEGHTVHATSEEAYERTEMMLNVYADFVEEFLAMPVLRGAKSPAERFPGAVDTLCIEAMMQDRKALQAGTSHFLGQNFAIASEIKFQSAEGKEEYAWTTSWGASTRLMGGLIMVHSDDDGLVLPPRIAPAQVVLMPIIKKEETRQAVMDYTNSLADELRALDFHGEKLSVEIDDKDKPGRAWDWIKKGVPIRVEIGPRDMEKNAVFMGRRDTPGHKKESMDRNDFVAKTVDMLDDMTQKLFQKALDHRAEFTEKVDGKDAFYKYFTPKNAEKPEMHGGFALSHWCGGMECEEKIKQDLAVTIRLIPFDAEEEAGECICCGKPSKKRVVFAKSY
ncbi:prolyl-tRNA synthetase [Desulfatibacillum alkenivorans DSM 16219]|jgi:prolyl-tRNA synthetase|uniref:Proline--tRNA ligase n=1 Tax=Desulfatibacillum alkenivorans DSM 16219 TaxID=1121393 RepID=A0A1M6BQ92_9BACT|nr:proline--tRNA ligase [Desulfatibacillum alkenivorans]SHI50861.1 prolyl-tRNA synthetase [Desulfatibacillum alkenivorans DSM 16219]